MSNSKRMLEILKNANSDQYENILNIIKTLNDNNLLEYDEIFQSEMIELFLSKNFNESKIFIDLFDDIKNKIDIFEITKNLLNKYHYIEKEDDKISIILNLMSEKNIAEINNDTTFKQLIIKKSLINSIKCLKEKKVSFNDVLLANNDDLFSLFNKEDLWNILLTKTEYNKIKNKVELQYIEHIESLSKNNMDKITVEQINLIPEWYKVVNKDNKNAILLLAEKKRNYDTFNLLHSISKIIPKQYFLQIDNLGENVWNKLISKQIFNQDLNHDFMNFLIQEVPFLGKTNNVIISFMNNMPYHLKRDLIDKYKDNPDLFLSNKDTCKKYLSQEHIYDWYVLSMILEQCNPNKLKEIIQPQLAGKLIYKTFEIANISVGSMSEKYDMLKNIIVWLLSNGAEPYSEMKNDRLKIDRKDIDIPFLIFKLEKDFPELSSTSLFFENIENILILNKEKRILEETFKENQKNKLTTVKRL